MVCELYNSDLFLIVYNSIMVAAIPCLIIYELKQCFGFIQETEERRENEEREIEMEDYQRRKMMKKMEYQWVHS
jgi:hypothetical protein